MARPGEAVRKALEAWIPLRVVDMGDIDLETFRFDYDLTFCALLMHPDGSILHTFGGRDATGAESHLSEAALARALTAARAAFDALPPSRKPPPNRAPRTVRDYPPMERRIREGKAKGCVHCHTVNQMETETLREEKRWRPEAAWRWPDPVQAGLRLDGVDQAVIAEVLPGSAAAKAGLRAGDRLTRFGGQDVITFGDVSRVLHEATAAAARLEVAWTREDAPRTGRLELAAGWKTPDPLTYAWRSSKWPLSPKPGFGGPDLSAEERRRLGVPEGKYAFRVNYLVDWGAEAETGRNARKAGLRKGDVVLSVAGRDEFAGQDHFHAWFRLTRRVGETVDVVVLRDGGRQVIRLPVIE